MPLIITNQSFSLIVYRECTWLNLLIKPLLRLSTGAFFSIHFLIFTLTQTWSIPSFPKVSSIYTALTASIQHSEHKRSGSAFEGCCSVPALFPEVFLCWQFLGWHWHLVGLVTRRTPELQWVFPPKGGNPHDHYKISVSVLDTFSRTTHFCTIYWFAPWHKCIIFIPL